MNPTIDPRIGDLQRNEDRKKFDKHWDLTRQEVAALGWKADRASYCEVELNSHPTAPMHSISFSPFTYRLRITFRPDGSDNLDWVEKRIFPVARQQSRECKRGPWGAQGAGG